MKSQLFVALLVVGLVMSALPSSACSNTTIQGGWGFLLAGANDSKLAAVVGQITADGKGGLTGSETIRSNGVISSNVALTGTDSITSICTGTAAITPSGFPAAKYNLTVVSTGKQIEMVTPTVEPPNSGTPRLGVPACARTPQSKAPSASKAGDLTQRSCPKPLPVRSSLMGQANLPGRKLRVQVVPPPRGQYPAPIRSMRTALGRSAYRSRPRNSPVIVNGDKSALEISTESGDITTTTVAKQ